jgi:putative transposase
MDHPPAPSLTVISRLPPAIVYCAQSQCYPLTVVDSFSRFVLAIQGFPSVAGDLAWPAFERAFRHYGLPRVMRTDNGSPFASSLAIAGLSRLSVRWLKLGIRVERNEPAHPEQNGRHEQMHRILKAEVARPPAADPSGQQERFDHFRREYNEDRPHEALGQKPPKELYQPSPRPYPKRVPKPLYPGHYEVRYVHRGGEIKWQGGYLFLSEALGGERVGLEEYDDGLWAVYFTGQRLARFDERERKLYG